MFMTPRESLAPLVLPLERESYLPYIKKMIKKILQIIDPFHDYNIYTTSSKESNVKNISYYNRWTPVRSY